MSQWTHVAAIFRIDALPASIAPNTTQESVLEAVGKESFDHYDAMQIIESTTGLSFYKEEDFSKVVELDLYKKLDERVTNTAKEYREHPERFLPMGSEGSLRSTIWEAVGNYAARFTVSVFGDLRDFGDDEDIQSVIDWFNNVCSKFTIRQATCNINVEFRGCYTLSYNSDTGYSKNFDEYIDRGI